MADLRSGSSVAEQVNTTFAPSGRRGMSASVNANGPRWLVAKAISQPCALWPGRPGMTPALLSRPVAAAEITALDLPVAASAGSRIIASTVVSAIAAVRA
jgi:hypothetical protein